MFEEKVESYKKNSVCLKTLQMKCGLMLEQPKVKISFDFVDWTSTLEYQCEKTAQAIKGNNPISPKK